VRGKKIIAEICGSKRERASCISATCDGRDVAPLVFQGYCNTAVFENYVENILCPALQPGQVVVMDNASFHKSQRTLELIEAAGCRLLFLPPYSPDFNKQESVWHSLKTFVKNNLKNFSYNIIATISAFFLQS
jgi:transposase